MKKIILIFFYSIFLSLVARAQNSLFHLDWNMTIPTGDLKEYISQESFRGVRFGGRAFLNDKISVGGESGWQVYYDKFVGTQRIDSEDGIYDLTGTQYRYLNTYPLLANIHYYLGEEDGIRPFLGTNLGLTFVNQRLAFGLYEVSETTTHFSFAPEIGVLVPIGVAGAGINIGARYDYVVKSKNLDSNIQSMSLFIGFIFMN